MNNIEETHPSLAEAYFDRNDRFPKYVVEVDFVQKHTIDIEVLKRVLIHNVRPDIWTRNIIISQIYRELGLEED
jgi:hypothetical protein